MQASFWSKPDFLRSGVMYALLNADGTQPFVSDLLIILVMNGVNR